MRRLLKEVLYALHFVAFVPLVLVALPLFLVSYPLYGIILQIVIWTRWCSRGTRVLLVTSNSPHWHDYIEANIVPRLPSPIVQLNWSERRHWNSFSLPVRAFRFFGGSNDFNPMVVVFRPFRWAKTFRFWKPFRDFKHGKTQSLETLEDDLFQYLSQAHRQAI